MSVHWSAGGSANADKNHTRTRTHSPGMRKGSGTSFGCHPSRLRRRQGVAARERPAEAEPSKEEEGERQETR